MLGGTSVDGASGLENMYYIDGTDITNIVNGTSGQSVSFDFVDEVQVKASGYQAEFGGSLGGVINVVTRSGGNEFHGEVVGYLQRRRPAHQVPRQPRLQPRRHLGRPVLSPYDYYIRQERRQPLRRRLQPRRLHLQGQALVLRLLPARLLQQHPHRRLRDSGTDVVEGLEAHRKPDELPGQADRPAVQEPAPERLASSTTSTSTKATWPTSSATPAPTISYDDYGFSYPNMSGSASAPT